MSRVHACLIRFIVFVQLMMIKGDVLVVGMTLPPLPKSTLFETYKVSQRHVFAHAIVNFGGCLTFAADGKTVATARIVVAGATQNMCVATKTAAALVGKPIENRATLLA
eukprot:SAG31_NODE_22851_length_516_cov_1.824940_1_plen_108_part_10